MVHVFALYQAHPGMRSKVFEFLSANTPAVEAEPGCIEYFATVDAQGAPGLQTPLGDDGFIVYERWVDMAALRGDGVGLRFVAWAATSIAERIRSIQ